VAFEPGYRVYQSAIAMARRTHRPHAEVTTAEVGEFEAAIERFDPHLVVCSQPDGAPANGRHAWVRFSVGSGLLATVCFDGKLSESENLELNELLSIIDETEGLARTKRDLGNC
jgi:hypothetical protein